MKKILLIFILFITTIFAEKIKIYHVNDMHGNIYNFSKIAYIIENDTTKNKLLVSAGDLFSGNPTVDIYNPKGYPMIDLMNKLNFLYSVIGNHEFDYGQKILIDRIKQAKFKFLCANFSPSNELKDLVKDYNIYTTPEGIKIAFLGLIETSNNGIPSTMPQKVKGIKFKNALNIAKKYKFLKDSSDIFIVLSHLGSEYDFKLAKIMPEIDIIIGGHSHEIINTEYNNVLIVQAKSYLRYLGEITIEYDKEKKKIISKKEKLIRLSKIKKYDKELKKLINKYENNPILKEVIGYSVAKIEGKSKLGALMTDAYKFATKADIAFQNNGGIRIHQIPKGKIILKQIYKLDPFMNKLITYQMNIKDIKSLIKYSIEHHGNNIDLQVSGMMYEVTFNPKEQIQNINLYDTNKKLLKNNKLYNVALNSYLADAYKFTYQKVIKKYDMTTEEAIINYIKSKKEINYSDIKPRIIAIYQK